MKIFVKDYNLSNIKNIFHLLDKYLVNKTNYYDVYSYEGHFNIENNNIYKIEHTDKYSKIYEKYSDDYGIIVDNSITNKKEVNQIPVDSIIIPVKMLHYSTDKKSKIKLLIQISSETDETILDFYFEINEDVDVNNIFIKNELNVFLSLLN
jgi:hypothetical protein